MTTYSPAGTAPRVALVLDNPQRDLPGLALIAVELAQNGIMCQLLPAGLRNLELFALAPDFVLLYNFRANSSKLIRKLASAGIAFGIHDTEGGVWPEIRTYADHLIQDASLRAKASFISTWGSAISEYLAQHAYFSPAQIKITGCPRFDFYHSDWNSEFEEVPAARPLRKRILLNTNYSEANSRFLSRAKVLEELCGVFHYTPEDAAMLVEGQQKALELSIELGRSLSRDFPSADIVLRPHPFESTEPYLNAFRDCPNVEVNVTGSVQAQIVRACATIQRYSTTAIESNFASVPALLPLWIPSPSGSYATVESVSVKCQNYAEMRRALQSVIHDEYRQSPEVAENVRSVTREWFHAIDGEAYRRIGEAILAALGAERSVNRAECARILHGMDGEPRPAPEALGKWVRYKLRLSPRWSFRSMRSIPFDEWTSTAQTFSVADVDSVVQRIVAQRRVKGLLAAPLRVSSAVEEREYLHGFRGHGVTIAAV